DQDSGQLAFVTSLPTLPDWWKTDDDDLATFHSITPPTGVLQPGHGYRLVKGDDPAFKGVLFYPLVRYGKSTSAAQGGVSYTCALGQLNAWRLHVDNDAFAVTNRVFGSTEAQADQASVSLSCTLFFAFRRIDGTDPVANIGNGVYV